MTKVEKYIRKMNIASYEVLSNGFIVHYPGTKYVVDIYVIVEEPAIIFKTFFMHKPRKRRLELYRYLLELNGKSFMVKWYLDDKGDIHLGTERLLKDMQASEFEAAMLSVVKGYEWNIDEARAIVEGP